MVSCLKMDTPQSFERAGKLFNGPQQEQLLLFGRASYTFAVMACRQGQYALAFETVSQSPRKTVLRSSLLVYLLAKLGRLSEAFGHLEGVLREAESDDRPLYNAKIIFPVETVTTLTECVAKSGDKAFKAKLASIFNRLDRIAEIKDQTLYDAMFTPVDCPKSMKYRREKNLRRLQKQKTFIADQDEETDELESNDDLDHRKSYVD